MSIGWQCPRCGRVYAPYVAECERCNSQTYPATTGTGTYSDLCPNCNQPRHLPGLTSCPVGSHYATYTLPFGSHTTT